MTLIALDEGVFGHMVSVHQCVIWLKNNDKCHEVSCIYIGMDDPSYLFFPTRKNHING